MKRFLKKLKIKFFGGDKPDFAIILANLVQKFVNLIIILPVISFCIKGTFSMFIDANFVSMCLFALVLNILVIKLFRTNKKLVELQKK